MIVFKMGLIVHKHGAMIDERIQLGLFLGRF